MSNSKLVSFTKISPNKNVNRKYPITRITPHCVVGQVTVEALGNLFVQTSREASSNYGIGKDGRVGLYVSESDRSWCSSSSDNDNRAVTIEVASDTYHPYAITDAAYKTLVNLCYDICKRNGKTKLIWFGDKDKTIAYERNGLQHHEMLITVHRWFANKACPGDYIYSRLGKIAEEVTKMLNAEEEEEEMTQEQFNKMFEVAMKNYRGERQDNDASSYSKDAREWAVKNGIINGTADKEFNGSWEDFDTREQVVTMLYRYDKTKDQAK